MSLTISEMSEFEREEGSKRKSPVGVPTVSYVDRDGTLIELLYDPLTEKTALAVSRPGGLWNIEQEVVIENGEKLVPYSPKNNLIANECVVLPSEPKEFESKANLLRDIKAYLHRYIDLSPLFEEIAAHYVLLTWVYERFNELPYLRFRGDYGTGKTRALMALGSLCYKGFFASGASTVSPIFHILDSFGGTLIFDESDLPFSDAKADLVKVFNNGTVRGMPVLRTVVNRQKEFNPYAFKVFGPKVIAMRGSFEDHALESRFLTEETGTRPLRQDIPVSLPKSARPEALELRNRLLYFRLCSFWEIKTDTTAIIDGIEPRLNQTAISLLSVVDDPTIRRDIQAMLIEANENIASERCDTADGAVLAAVAEAFSGAAGANIPLGEIARIFNRTHSAEYGGRVSTRWVGHMLRKRFNLKPRKSDGIFVLSASDKPTIDALAARIGL
jgi:hypothetical protein